jgi:adenylate cyclase
MIGDGFLVEFASALAAVNCAVELQKALARRNLGAPSGRQLQVRIGIHLGHLEK